MNTKTAMLAQQRAWAAGVGKLPDSDGYLASYSDNLWRPLSPQALKEFGNGSVSELTHKMRALHSSSALAANFFDYWTAADCAPLEHALGLHSPVKSIAFEAQHRTGLKGTPPNLDVCILLESRHLVAIESKFCEWLVPKKPDLARFHNAYLAAGRNLWDACDLPHCQILAHAIYGRSESFQHLDVLQLLKHTLGLAHQRKTRFHPDYLDFGLYYLYYDCSDPDSPVATMHRAEIDRFSALVGAEIGFQALTYQDLFARLQDPGVDSGYLDYLQTRYFS